MANENFTLDQEKAQQLYDALTYWDSGKEDPYKGLTKKEALSLLRHFRGYENVQNIDEAIGNADLLRKLKILDPNTLTKEQLEVLEDLARAREVESEKAKKLGIEKATQFTEEQTRAKETLEFANQEIQDVQLKQDSDQTTFENVLLVEPEVEQVYISPPAIVQGLYDEATQNPEKFVEKYTKTFNKTLKEPDAPKLSTRGRPPDLAVQVKAKQIATGVYDAVTKGNIGAALVSAVTTNDPTTSESEKISKYAVGKVLGKKAAEYIVPPPLAYKKVSQPTSKSYVVYPGSQGLSIVSSSLVVEPALKSPFRQFIASSAVRQLAKTDLKEALEMQIAINIDPDSVEAVMARARKAGYIPSPNQTARLHNLARSRYWNLISRKNLTLPQIETYFSGTFDYDPQILTGASGVIRMFFQAGGQLFGKASSKLIDKALAEEGVAQLSKKALSALGKKGAGKAAKFALSRAVGFAGEFFGGPIGQILVEAVMKLLKKIAGLLKGLLRKILNHPEALFGAALGLGALGLALGSLPLGIAAAALGTLALAAGGTAAITGGLTLALGSVAGLFYAVIFPNFARALIITTLIVIFFTGFAVLIINSGAFIVPPVTQQAGAQSVNPGLAATGTCPLVGDTRISQTSYNPSTETGHGSNAYWRGPSCSYPIPVWSLVSGCGGPSPEIDNYNPNNQCTSLSNQTMRPEAQGLCPYFGYAVDVEPVGQPLSREVQLPFLCEAGVENCGALSWKKTNGWYNCRGNSVGSKAECNGTGWGYGYIFEAQGDGTSWKIYINHIDPNANLLSGNLFQSGEAIGIKSTETGHIHLELVVNSVPVVPDFLCGGIGGAAPEQAKDGDVLEAGVDGWLIKGELSASNVAVSTPGEFGRDTCSWAQSKGLAGAVNANFFDGLQSPIGVAGSNGSFTNLLGSDQANRYSTLTAFEITGNSSSHKPAGDVSQQDLSNWDRAVTGVDYFTLADGVRARTALGIIDGELSLLVTKAASRESLREAMNKLGATWSMVLDGGKSSTFCEGGTPLFPEKPTSVSVSIGVRSGTIHKLVR